MRLWVTQCGKIVPATKTQTVYGSGSGRTLYKKVYDDDDDDDHDDDEDDGGGYEKILNDDVVDDEDDLEDDGVEEEDRFLDGELHNV